MFLAVPGRQFALRTWFCLSGCLTACSLQMPSESDVFGSAGSASEASGGTSAGAGPLGDSGSEENGGAESPAGAGGIMNTGASGSAGKGGATGTGGTTGSSGATGASGAIGASGATGFDPAAGLISYFTFDDPSGSVASNAKDSSKNAKCVGTCTRPAGQLGLAFAIRNNVSPTDWVELPTGVFSGRSAVTLSVWLRDLSTARNVAPLFHFSLGESEAIFLIPDDKNGSATGAHLRGVHTGTPFVDLWSATPVLTDKVWHHLAFSWNSASIDLYIDGKSVGSTANPKVLPSQLGATSPNYLGRLPDDTSLALFGEVDDLRIYDRVLSAAQVALLYRVR